MDHAARRVRLALSIAAIALAGAAATARADAVKVAKNDKAGSYLTDSKGMTLYTFKKDAQGKSACAGDCVAKWPLYDDAKVQASGNVSSKDFGTITREDGKKQTTYKGMPLYYFSGDQKPGDVNGHGFRDVWSVATP